LAGAAGKLSASETHDRFLLASYDLGIARTGIIDPKVISMLAARSFGGVGKPLRQRFNAKLRHRGSLIQ